MTTDKKSQGSLPYRPCVGIMLLNRQGRVFVGRRNDVDIDAWQMPQGGIDPHEDAKTAALRELVEETGIRDVKVIAETHDWLTYDYPPAIARRSFANRYRGQRQKWFVMRFLGFDHDIDLRAGHAEFNTWKWVGLDDLVPLIVTFKRPVYETVVAEFRHLASPECD